MTYLLRGLVPCDAVQDCKWKERRERSQQATNTVARSTIGKQKEQTNEERRRDVRILEGEGRRKLEKDHENTRRIRECKKRSTRAEEKQKKKGKQTKKKKKER